MRSAVSRFAIVGELASTKTMLHLGQIAETISTSSASSSPQPLSVRGSFVPPVWLTTVKLGDPDPLVEIAAIPYWFRYLLMSFLILGSL